MTLFIQLLLAHLIGDFIFQPTAMVAHKQQHKLRSLWLYVHCAIHGLLSFILVGDPAFWLFALIVAVSHLLIDALKLVFSKPDTQRTWFFADQLLHLAILAGVFLWNRPGMQSEIGQWLSIHRDFNLSVLFCILFLSSPASIVIKVIISRWAPMISGIGNPQEDDSLLNAGKYIGMLERLFVFGFIVSGHFEATGFLLAAKSIFRFGDLRNSGDRKLTEYVLIGTLVSFGIAMITGMLFVQLLITT